MSLHFPWESMLAAALHKADSELKPASAKSSSGPAPAASAQPARTEPKPPGSAPGANSARSRLIKAQNETRAQFGPSPSVETHCNGALCFTARAMHVPVEPFENSDGAPYTANQITQNLPTSRYYKDVTPQEAQTLGNSGHFVVGAYFNPHGHGHVVTVRPADVAGDKPFGNHGPLLNDVGQNDRIARQSGAFAPGDQVHYYTPYTGDSH